MTKNPKRTRQRRDLPIELTPDTAWPTLTPTSPLVTDVTHLKELMKKIATDRASETKVSPRSNAICGPNTRKSFPVPSSPS
jgi:hypothetical protein